MRYGQLVDAILALGVEEWATASSRCLGDRLGALHGARLAVTEAVGRCGLPAQVVVLVDELHAAGRPVPSQLEALASTLLLAPVTSRDGLETWPDSVQRGREAAEEELSWTG